MKEKKATACLAAGLCVAVAFLRMLAPSLPFDWMTLALVLGAAGALLLAGKWSGQDAPAAASPEAETLSEAEKNALRTRMAGTSWPTEAGQGALFQALGELHAKDPFAALCAARGTLMMLQEKNKAPEGGDAKTTLSLLGDALGRIAHAGARQADGKTVELLFAYTLRALTWLEQNNA